MCRQGWRRAPSLGTGRVTWGEIPMYSPPPPVPARPLEKTISVVKVLDCNANLSEPIENL